MAEIQITELTTKETDGTGVFDEIMETIQVRLENEFSKGRIKGSDYAKVYLGAMESSLGQAIQFILGRQQADKQAELLEQQRLKAIEETALVVQQVLNAEAEVLRTKQEVINLTLQGVIYNKQAEKLEQEILVEQQQVLNMQQQVLKTAAEVSMLAKQEDKIDAEIAIAYQQLTQTAAEIELIHARTDLVLAQIASENQNTAKIQAEVILMGKQGNKLDEEVQMLIFQRTNVLPEELIKLQKETGTGTYNGNGLLDKQITVQHNQGNLLISQGTKTDKEALLIMEKTEVEKAQYASNAVRSVDEDSVIGRQKELYYQQAEGFKRDAEQKAAKIMADIFAVRKSADVATETTGTGLTNENTKRVINDLLVGIGVTPE